LIVKRETFVLIINVYRNSLALRVGVIMRKFCKNRLSYGKSGRGEK